MWNIWQLYLCCFLNEFQDNVFNNFVSIYCGILYKRLLICYVTGKRIAQIPQSEKHSCTRLRYAFVLLLIWPGTSGLSLLSVFGSMRQIPKQTVRVGLFFFWEGSIHIAHLHRSPPCGLFRTIIPKYSNLTEVFKKVWWTALLNHLFIVSSR